MVLEGGSIAVDGAGTLVTTERCLLNPNRNPELTAGRHRATRCRRRLGVDRIVWLADAIAEDDGTDGHVDNVVAFTAPGRALLQGCADPDNPNHAIAIDNRRRLEAAGIDGHRGSRSCRTPTFASGRAHPGPLRQPLRAERRGARADRRRPRRRRRCSRSSPSSIPAARSSPVPGAVLAYGGGGVHCITQQVPA